MPKSIEMTCRHCGKKFTFQFETDDDVVRNHSVGWPCPMCNARQIINGMTIEQVQDNVAALVDHLESFLDGEDWSEERSVEAA